jgi:hypothetical protein
MTPHGLGSAQTERIDRSIAFKTQTRRSRTGGIRVSATHMARARTSLSARRKDRGGSNAVTRDQWQIHEPTHRRMLIRSENVRSIVPLMMEMLRDPFIPLKKI